MRNPATCPNPKYAITIADATIAPLRMSRSTSREHSGQGGSSDDGACQRRDRVDGKHQGKVRGIEEQDRVRGEQERVQRDPCQECDPGRSPLNIPVCYGETAEREAAHHSVGASSRPGRQA